MSVSLSQKLNLLMAEARVNSEELSRRIGLPASTIKKIRNGENVNPTLSTMTTIAKYFALTLSELVGEVEFPRFTNRKCNDESIQKIPLISWESALTWPDSILKNTRTISTEYQYSDDAYALLVEEDNWDNLSKNTALIIDPDIEMEHRDFVIVLRKGNQLPTLKQALFDDGNIYLKPPVNGYQLTTLNDEYRILGVVVEYHKNLKNYR